LLWVGRRKSIKLHDEEERRRRVRGRKKNRIVLVGLDDSFTSFAGLS